MGGAHLPNLLVGLDDRDDATVYRLNDEQAVVLSVDFFAPLVDDPYAFGAIAAANAMSDVYAMGGEVLLALNVAAFPDDLNQDIHLDGSSSNSHGIVMDQRSCKFSRTCESIGTAKDHSRSKKLYAVYCPDCHRSRGGVFGIRIFSAHDTEI